MTCDDPNEAYEVVPIGMRWIWNPSIKPTRDDHTRDDHKVHLVVDGFGHNGRIFRERDVETTVTDLMSEQCVAPVRVVAVNRAEHRLADASEDIALEILRRVDSPGTSYHHRYRRSS